MTTPPPPPTRLRLLNALVYAGLALFAIASVAAPLLSAVRVITRPYSYAPNLTLPWFWVALAAFVCAAIFDGSRRIAAGQRAGLPRYVAILLAVGLALSAGRMLQPPRRPIVEEALAHLVARAELAASAAYSRDKHYPDSPAPLLDQWLPELRALGYYQRWARPLRSELIIAPNATGPVFIAPAGTQPGDVVLALSADRQHYWLTAFVLDKMGRVALLLDHGGRALVASASEGHVASRLDPLFPEYPNKLSPPTRPW